MAKTRAATAAAKENLHEEPRVDPVLPTKRSSARHSPKNGEKQEGVDENVHPSSSTHHSNLKNATLDQSTNTHEDDVEDLPESNDRNKPHSRVFVSHEFSTKGRAIGPDGKEHSWDYATGKKIVDGKIVDEFEQGTLPANLQALRHDDHDTFENVGQTRSHGKILDEDEKHKLKGAKHHDETHEIPQGSTHTPGERHHPDQSGDSPRKIGERKKVKDSLDLIRDKGDDEDEKELKGKLHGSKDDNPHTFMKY